MTRVHFLSCYLLLVSSAVRAQEAHVVAPEYAGRGTVGGTLVIAPFSAKLVIRNPSDVRDDLGAGDPTEVFLAFVKANLPRLLREHSTFTVARYGSSDGTPSLVEQTLDVGRRYVFWTDRMTMRLPARGTTVGFGPAEADFVLFLQDFEVERSTEPSGTGDDDAVLRYTAKYAIWDRREGRLACYGRIDAYDAVWMRMTRATWDHALTEFAKSITRGSPFRN